TLDVGGARLGARDHHRRITRRDLEQAEDEQRDDLHHRYCRKKAPEDIGQHADSPLRQADFDTPQKNGSGPFAIPLMFFRHAVELRKKAVAAKPTSSSATRLRRLTAAFSSS